MKIFLLLAATALAVGSISSTASAQSLPQNGCGGVQAAGCPCGGISTVPGSGSSEYVIYDYDYCCDKLIIVAYDGGSCFMGRMRDLLRDKTMLTLAAAGVELMVPDCDGNLQKVTPNPSARKPQWDDLNRIVFVAESESGA